MMGKGKEDGGEMKENDNNDNNDNGQKVLTRKLEIRMERKKEGKTIAYMMGQERQKKKYREMGGKKIVIGINKRV